MSLPAHVGRLVRVDRIGAGGFATVWRYHDPALQCDVAVKALAENWCQRLDVRERFLEEARILRRADSDHVVRVHDVGEVDSTPYFVMTYADRGSLATLVADGAPVDPGRVVDLVTQAGIGLSMLHEQGVVHRDVKPENLLLCTGGVSGERVLVADLGVAKAVAQASGLTQVVGTPSYMAPEQAAGLGVDERADVHALAAVAYRLLSGRVVRECTLAELARAELPPPPSELVAGLPAALDEVLLRALEPDPTRRLPDVATFVAALRAAVPAQAGDPRDDARRAALTLYELPPPRPARASASTVATRGGTTALWVVLIFLAAFGTAFTVTSLLT